MGECAGWCGERGDLAEGDGLPTLGDDSLLGEVTWLPYFEGECIVGEDAALAIRGEEAGLLGESLPKEFVVEMVDCFPAAVVEPLSSLSLLLKNSYLDALGDLRPSLLGLFNGVFCGDAESLGALLTGEYVASSKASSLSISCCSCLI